MAIAEGSAVPEAGGVIWADGPKPTTLAELFAGKKSILFGVPGAFTPTCSAQHLPGYIARAADLRAKGVDAVACVSVNDAFVMDAWGVDRGAADDVLMLADGNGDFAKAVGLDFDGSGIGFGTRSQRYALVANDGVVEVLAVEEPMKFDVSSAEAILGQL